MANVYDGVFRTILNDCRKMVIPVINEIFGETYIGEEPEQQEIIGAFDKWTIIELSRDVIKEIAQIYKNAQKGVGDMMSGPLIQTSARAILKETALRMLKDGKLSSEKIAEYSGLDVAEVQKLGKTLIVAKQQSGETKDAATSR